MVPWSFSPELEPGDHGPFYEMRSYICKAGSINDIKERWLTKYADRTALSPMNGVFSVDIGKSRNGGEKKSNIMACADCAFNAHNACRCQCRRSRCSEILFCTSLTTRATSNSMSLRMVRVRMGCGG